MVVLRRAEILSGDTSGACAHRTGNLPVSRPLIGGRVVGDTVLVDLFLQAIETYSGISTQIP